MRSDTQRRALGRDRRLDALDLIGHARRMLEAMATGQEDLDADVLDGLSRCLRRAARHVRVARWEARP